MTVFARARDALLAPVPPAPLGAFRAAFGALMVVHTYRLHALGMYERAVLRPALHFHYGVAVPPPSAAAGACHLAVLGASALGVAKAQVIS